jgi:hypothetical protein
MGNPELEVEDHVFHLRRMQFAAGNDAFRNPVESSDGSQHFMMLRALMADLYEGYFSMPVEGTYNFGPERILKRTGHDTWVVNDTFKNRQIKINFSTSNTRGLESTCKLLMEYVAVLRDKELDERRIQFAGTARDAILAPTVPLLVLRDETSHKLKERMRGRLRNLRMKVLGPQLGDGMLRMDLPGIDPFDEALIVRAQDHWTPEWTKGSGLSVDRGRTDLVTTKGHQRVIPSWAGGRIHEIAGTPLVIWSTRGLWQVRPAENGLSVTVNDGDTPFEIPEISIVAMASFRPRAGGSVIGAQNPQFVWAH